MHIFSATETGGQLSTSEQTYTRGGSTTCGGITVPYTLGTTDYPYSVRCSDLDRTDVLPGFTGPVNTGVDIIGVRIDYRYRYVTPIGLDDQHVGLQRDAHGADPMIRARLSAGAIRAERRHRGQGLVEFALILPPSC